MNNWVSEECNSEKYILDHKYCPNCGCCACSTTMMCCYGDRDTNNSRCGSCSWHGKVHDRVSCRERKNCDCKYCLKDSHVVIMDEETENKELSTMDAGIIFFKKVKLRK